MKLIQIDNVKNVFTKTNLIRFNNKEDKFVKNIYNKDFMLFDPHEDEIRKDVNKNITILILSEEDLNKQGLNVKGVSFNILLIPKQFKDTWFNMPVARQIKPCIIHESYAINYY